MTVYFHFIDTYKEAFMPEQKELKENEKKWTPELLEAGWVMIPNVLLERQQALGLSALDVNILLQILRHWWKKDELPFPSKKTIAECIGIKENTVQKRIREMERDGLIKRVPRRDSKHNGQTSNAYVFDGLIEAATPFAKEILEERKARSKEVAARRTRKRPKRKTR